MMENSVENYPETPISSSTSHCPHTSLMSPSSALSISIAQLASSLEQLMVEDHDKNESIDAAATHTGSNSNNAGHYACLGDEGSAPNQNWFIKNFPFTDNDIPSTSYSNSKCPYKPFPGFPSFSDWARQDRASNARTWLRGGSSFLTREDWNLNNGFSSESPRVDHFAATGNGRNGIYSNGSSIIYGDTWNGQGYHRGGQDWLQLVDVLEEAMNEDGSKKLQVILALNDQRKTNMIFEKTLPGLLIIMTNKYGQFLFAKLIDSCNTFQMHMIVSEVTSEIETLIAISAHKYGSRCVKCIIKKLEKSPLVIRMTLALSCGFFELMIHKTGSYTILRCFEVLNCQQNEALYAKLIEQCLELATHEIGCLSLNRSISHIKGSFRDDLLYKISSHAAYLAHDPTGNFVIQHVIGLANPFFTEIICEQLREHYVALSTQKGGSHVVERCLKSKYGQHAIQELIKCDKLGLVARDQYGNYVVQTALRETKRVGSPLHQVLLRKIASLNELHHGYGKRVLDFINEGVPLNN